MYTKLPRRELECNYILTMYSKEKIKPQVRFVIRLYLCAYPAMIDKLNDLTATNGGENRKETNFAYHFYVGTYITIYTSL